MSILPDVRLGFRLMLRQPLMAATAIVALAVGIGLATVGFAAMEALLFSRLPFEGGDRFVRLRPVTELDRQPVALTAESYARLTSAATALEHVGVFTTGRESVERPAGPVEELAIAGLSPSSLRYLPAVPLRGRLLGHDDGVPGREPVAVISETYWRRALAGAESAVGSAIDVGGTRRTIIGVMPADFEFPNRPAIWIPLDERFREGRARPDSDARLFGVLAPVATLGSLAVQLAAVSPQVKAAAGDARVSIDATDFTDLGPMAPMLSAALVFAVLAVLIVIGANVGNLVLARSLARAREFALRAALGASRGRLVSQVMVEVLVLGGIAAVLGSLAASAALRQVNADDMPFWIDFSGGTVTAVLVAAATLLATAIAGAWPALRATRRDLLAGLQGSGARTSDVQFGRAAGLILVGQIAISVAMLHGALVVAQGFRDYTHGTIELPRNVMAMGLGVNAVRVSADGTRTVPLTAAEAERIAAGLPGVIAAGAATALPRHSPDTRLIEMEPGPGETARPARLAPSASVSPAFFDALDAKAQAGRLFTKADTLAGAAPVAVVNEPFVRTVLGGGSAIGRRFRVAGGGQPGPWVEIVGVVRDLGLSVGDPSLAAGYYEPLMPEANVVYLALRVQGESLAYAEPLRRALRARDPQVVPFRAERLEDVALDDRSFFAMLSSVLIGVGVVTLVLALVGVYSMMSLIVARRTREIGIRVALGSTSAGIVRSVAGRAAGQLAAGGALGALLAVLSLEGRSILVSRLGDGGPWTLPLVLGVLMASGVAATWVPLGRALRIRPQEALKAD